MIDWKLRFAGFLLMILGGILFMFAVRDINSEWPRILTGLLSVFCASLGFGFLILPRDPDEDSPDPR